MNRKHLAIGAALLATYLILRKQRKSEPLITYTDSLPFNYNALTVPPIGIFIRQDQQANASLLEHEIVHWRQYQRMGLIPYYFNYAGGMIQHGYDGHPMEQEARANESSECQANYTQCVRDGRSVTVSNPMFRT